MAKVIGKVKITIVEAAGLAPKDGRGLNNPYAKVQLGERKEKTEIQYETNNPSWNESFVLPVYKFGDLVEINLFTAEKGSKGEFLGMYKLNLEELVDKGEVDNWYTLQKRTKRSNVTGKIHLRLLYTSIDKQDVYIDITEAKGLSLTSTFYVKVKFGAAKDKTANSSATDNPEWTNTLVFPYDDTEKAIKFYLIDQDNRRTKVGIAQLLLSDLKHDDINDVWLPLISLKKKDAQVGELHIRLSIGEDLETLSKVPESAASSSKLGRKKSKRSKKSTKKTTNNEDDSEFDESEMSDLEDSSSSRSSRRSSRRGSVSEFKLKISNSSDDESGSSKGGPDEEEEDEDSILASMPRNFKPVGKVLLEIREARNLVADGGGKKDVVFIVSGQSQVFTSYCIRQTLNPVWNEMCSIRVSTTQTQIKVGIRAYNETKYTLGQVLLDVWQFETEPISDWFHLRPATRKSSPVSGDIYITATYIPFQEISIYARNPSPRAMINPANFSGRSPRERETVEGSIGGLKPSSGPVGTLSVIVLQATDLLGKDGQLISSVKLSIDDGVEKTTPTVKGTTNPVWTVNHSFTFPVQKVKDSELRFTVLDNLRVDAPGFLGCGTVALEALAAAEDRSIERWFTLQRKIRKARVTGRLRLKLRLDLPRQRGDGSLFSPEMEVDDSTKHDLLFKVILVGESGVGKTGLFNRFNRVHFEMGTKATIGSEITCKSFRAEKKIVKVQLWDTAGQERFRSVTRQYYRGAMGAILVYDITNKQSFDKLQSWIDDLKDYSQNPNIQLLLVGNKSDLSPSRSVTRFEAAAFAEMNNMLFLETSALEKVNVQRAFQTILTDIYDVSLQHGSTGVKDLLDDDDPNFKFDATTGKVIVLTPEMTQPTGVQQTGTGYCAC